MGLINYPELGATADSIEEELEYFARSPLLLTYFAVSLLESCTASFTVFLDLDTHR